MTDFETLKDILQQLNMASITVRLLLATLGGALIGASRGKVHHAAGMRTHMLVCVGAACCAIVGQFSSQTLGYGGDPERIAAQVVSGIGFLGAGSIIVTGKRHIVGVTTAAGLWASACMGLAAGTGYLELSLLMIALIFIDLVVLYRWDSTHIKATKEVMAYVEIMSDQRLSVLLKGITAIGLDVVSIEQFGKEVGNITGYKLEMEATGPAKAHSWYIGEISQIDGVLYVDEMKA